MDASWSQSKTPRCEFYLEAPKDHVVNISVTKLVGFPSAGKKMAYSPSSSSDRSPENAQDCLPRIDITEIMTSGRERAIQTLCSEGITPRNVIVSDTHLVKLSFSWSLGHASGFTIDFVFVKQLGEYIACIPLLSPFFDSQCIYL